MPARLAPAMAPTETPDETLGCAASPGSSGDPVDRAGEACRPLRLALPADPVAPSVARHRLRRWLAGLAWPAVERFIWSLIPPGVSKMETSLFINHLRGIFEIFRESEPETL